MGMNKRVVFSGGGHYSVLWSNNSEVLTVQSFIPGDDEIAAGAALDIPRGDGLTF